MRLLVPAYIYPGAPPRTEWSLWIGAARTFGWIIANPGSPGGPGTFTDSNYAAVIAAAQAQGIGIFGYVDTGYGAVAIGTVTSQVDDWKTFYGINDIFFDQVSSNPADLAYYTTATNYVRSTHVGAKTMLNPGTTTDEGYFALADILCVFEGTKASYDSYLPSAWNAHYNADHFCHLIHTAADEAAMRSVVSKARSLNAGYIYVTDPSSWFAMPPFFAAEVNALDLLNAVRRTATWAVSSSGGS